MQTWFISRNSAEMHQLTHSSDEWKTDGINHLEAFKKCVAGRDSKCWDLMRIYKSLKIFSVPNLYLLIVEGLVIRKKKTKKKIATPDYFSDSIWIFCLSDVLICAGFSSVKRWRQKVAWFGATKADRIKVHYWREQNSLRLSHGLETYPNEAKNPV